MMEIDQLKAWCFFHGASQGNMGPNGVDGMLYLSINQSFTFEENLGRGRNNWKTIQALKLLLGFAKEKDVGKIQVFRISNMVM